MQMFGVGVLELMVILVLAVIVIGPDRVPQFAADLARWIRQTRAYAKHLMGDFNEVVSELEKEAGASREDWKEIASVVTRHTGNVGKELSRLGTEIEQSGDLADAKASEPETAVAAETNGGTPANGDSAVLDHEEPETREEKPWYVPEKTTTRRRSRE